MTLDDEAAERIARTAVKAMGSIVDRLMLAAQAGYAARDAEVEELRAERDEALATIERAKAAEVRTVELLSGKPAKGENTTSTLRALNTAPADTLRERDAALIEELADAALDESKGIPFDADESRAIVASWITERARERREGVS